MQTADASAALRAALGELQRSDHDGGEVVLDSGLSYAAGHPVGVRVRRRGHRYDLSDDGAATSRADRPPGWLEAADRVVADSGFNVNRRGVVFVPAVEGRDLVELTLRLAESSLEVYLALLDLQDNARR